VRTIGTGFTVQLHRGENTTEGAVCCVIGAQKPRFPGVRNRLTCKGRNIRNSAAHNHSYLGQSPGML
jgi:hypothetical protein